MEKIKFYKENETETIVASTEKLDETKYTELEANTNGNENKHLPVYEINDNKIIVNISKEIHPMEEDHYIAWIALINGYDINKVDLYPNDEPKAEFDYIKGSEIYAYCNKHELWKIVVE